MSSSTFIENSVVFRYIKNLSIRNRCSFAQSVANTLRHESRVNTDQESTVSRSPGIGGWKVTSDFVSVAHVSRASKEYPQRGCPHPIQRVRIQGTRSIPTDSGSRAGQLMLLDFPSPPGCGTALTIFSPGVWRLWSEVKVNAKAEVSPVNIFCILL